MSMHLLLVVPGLLSHSAQTLATAPSLVSLQRYASAPRVTPDGLANALLAAVGAPTDTPLAPVAALGAGLDPADDRGYVTFADPVLLAADRDDVVLMQRVDDLDEYEAGALVATLIRHFADDDLRFEIARADAWFARSAHAPDLATTPFDAAHRRGIFLHLPRGRDSGKWKRWGNEIEMLLHEHPVNAAREAAGRVPVSAIWFWGGGRLADVDLRALPALAVTAARNSIGDIARGLARAGSRGASGLGAETTTARALERATGTAATTALIVVDAADRATSLADLDVRWLAPAIDALSRHHIASLDLLADGNGVAARWTIAPPSLWQRMTARGKPFVVPALPV